MGEDQVCAEYLYEIVFGCIRIIQYAIDEGNEPSKFTRSWRLRRERQTKYDNWLTDRMNSEGWADLGDRLEIVWGPDYLGRYDLYLFRGNGMKLLPFSYIPSDITVPAHDMRKEFEAFYIG